ncbi:glycosyl transferase [Celeribacter ethanolicus]|uniref:Glycosyl transferase n=1 Tax=Celeribacter ethanolicus TaxID=1758178 RepID=A0A291GH83_9RHOB|nr:glycosyltransferase family 39 protein [Celeribacter ethanolicus]ATG49450.1 glycosyl transferase [Celeribacter ethanolicus]
MQTDAPQKTPLKGWLPLALVFAVVAVALRLVALAFDRTDLFVDEVQYWFWGQNLDFGYYSKPPLIGWVIRLATDLADSDAAFWVRMPGAVLHGITALLLGALAARVQGRAAALWTVAIYLSLPFVALGSVMISTDTVMAPFYAAALLFFFRTAETRRAGDALAVGLFAGFAFMAKYAGIYFLVGSALVMLSQPALRPGWRNLGLMILAFAVVISPNVLWNLSHDLTTVSHTMDNAGWVRDGAAFDLGSLATFLASQFGVFGPVTMGALILAYLRPHGGLRPALVLFSLPALVVVSVQALLDQAYANWAIATYFAGTVLAVTVMTRFWRIVALSLNLVLALSLPVLIVLAPWPEIGGKPVLERYLGRHALSESILDLAEAEELPVVTGNRDILADLFYTGRDRDVALYAMPEIGRASSYYAQNQALPDSITGEVLVVVTGTLPCDAAPLEGLDLRGIYAGRRVKIGRAAAECLRETP